MTTIVCIRRARRFFLLGCCSLPLLVPALSSAQQASEPAPGVYVAAASDSIRIKAPALPTHRLPDLPRSHAHHHAQLRRVAAHRPAAPLALRPSSTGVLLPAGTPLEVRLETRLASNRSKPGDGFAARVMQSVYYHGQEIVPAGSILEGKVIQANDRRPALGASSLLLRPDQLQTPAGQSFTLAAEVSSAQAASSTNVDSEGSIHGKRGPENVDVVHAAGLGATGAAAGLILSGSKAAMIGGGAGAAIAGGLWLFAHRHLVLNPGAVLIVRLDAPMRLTATAPASPDTSSSSGSRSNAR